MALIVCKTNCISSFQGDSVNNYLLHCRTRLLLGVLGMETTAPEVRSGAGPSVGLLLLPPSVFCVSRQLRTFPESLLPQVKEAGRQSGFLPLPPRVWAH